MPSRKNDFPKTIALKALLWCRRVCCLCGKTCGAGIELAHIDREKPGTLDNAIPVCFDCHFAIGHYVDEHPRGKKYGVDELKARRKQIYDEQTAPLVPPISFRLTQQNPPRELPDVGFQIQNLGAIHPVRAFVRVTVAMGTGKHQPPKTVGHYDDSYAWNLNPRQVVSGLFKLRAAQKPIPKNPLRAKIEVRIHDIYDYPHPLYPVGYVLDHDASDWYAEPCEELM